MIAALIGDPSVCLDRVVQVLRDRGVSMLRYAAEIHDPVLILFDRVPGLSLHAWTAGDYGQGGAAVAMRDRAMILGEGRSAVHILLACPGKSLAAVALAHASRIRVLELQEQPQVSLFKTEDV